MVNGHIGQGPFPGLEYIQYAKGSLRRHADRRVHATGVDRCDLVTSTGIEAQFAIDLRFGSFSYVSAKLIQICWDLFIGQGGRLLHGWVLLIALSDTCILLLERYGAPHDFYTHLAITSSSFDLTVSCVKILTRKRNWQVIVIAIWALWSMLHVLMFPVLWSAATSYLNPSKPYVQLPTGEMVTENALQPCVQILDGARIGLQNNEIVFGDQDINECELIAASLVLHLLIFEDLHAAILLIKKSQESLQHSQIFNSTTFPSTYNDSYTYASSGNQQLWEFDGSVPLGAGIIPYTSSITFAGHTYNLSAPVLPFASLSLDDNENSLVMQYASASLLCHNSTPIMQDPDSFPMYCVTDQEFVWGFSSFLVTIGLSFEAAWVMMLYLVWLNANVRSVLLKRGINLGNLHKNMADLVRVLQYNLENDMGSLSKAQLKKELKQISDIRFGPQKEDGWECTGFCLETREQIRKRSSSERLIAGKA